ncbi:MAG: outer membrane lipoprotein-sorting protein [Planctomycetes bacterium]|nr:outer membrane lipoprotein-sorting protein [Planctomycetota bacterium]
MNKRKCFLPVSILCMLSVSVPIVAAGSPDARDARKVLRRFAKARENYTSFILEAKTKTTFNYPQQHWKGEQYSNAEYRFDGNRGRECFSLWGNVDMYSTDVPENQAQYSSNLWDGKDHYTYNRPSAIGTKPGRVAISQKEDPEGVPKTRTTFVQNSVFPGLIMGYYQGDSGKRISEVLGRAKQLQLRQEKLRGVDCYVIDAVVRGKGKYTLWIDPIHDYHIAKIHVQRRGNDYYNTSKIPKNDSSDELYEVLRFQKIEDSWFPLEYKTKTETRMRGNLGTFERNAKITHIVLDPDHDALGSFLPDDVPNGSVVRLLSLPPSMKFVWQDGVVVDKDGRKVDVGKLIKAESEKVKKPKPKRR